MNNQLAKADFNQDIVSNIVLKGDLSGLKPGEKTKYYFDFCQSLGLNPLTQPFQIIDFKGKQVLYATKDCTEQLRKIHSVSVIESKTEKMPDLFMVTVKVMDKGGRTDVATGVVVTKGLFPSDLANAIMKAETKAKRRATLSICGLGMLDESELDTVGSFKTQEIKLTPEAIKKEAEMDNWDGTNQAIKSEPVEGEEVVNVDDIAAKLDEPSQDKPAVALKDNSCETCASEGNQTAVSDKVRDFSLQHFGQVLCFNHQPKR